MWCWTSIVLLLPTLHNANRGNEENYFKICYQFFPFPSINLDLSLKKTPHLPARSDNPLKGTAATTPRLETAKLMCSRWLGDCTFGFRTNFARREPCPATPIIPANGNLGMYLTKYIHNFTWTRWCNHLPLYTGFNTDLLPCRNFSNFFLKRQDQ